MKIELIIFIIMMLAAIFEKQIRSIPSRGNWIYEHEDEKWVKILLVAVRIIFFVIGLIGFIYFAFFN